MKCTNLGSSPNVNGSPILATILANPYLRHCWLYIKGVIKDVLDPILFWLIWDYLGSNAPCFLVHCLASLLRWPVPPLALQLYIFLQYLHYASILSIYYSEVISCYRCASTRSFAYRIGLGKVKGRNTRGGGNLIIFKRIKFITCINTKVKVFYI